MHDIEHINTYDIWLSLRKQNIKKIITRFSRCLLDNQHTDIMMIVDYDDDCTTHNDMNINDLIEKEFTR